MKDYFIKLIAQKEKQAENLRSKIKASTSADEVRSMGEDLQSIVDEITEARAKLAEIEAEEKRAVSVTNIVTESAAPIDSRSFNPLAAYGQSGTPAATETRDIALLDSMEYRTAFMKYVQTGKWELEQRADEQVTTGDIGKIIPNTILNEFIRELSTYGQLYNRVRKMNIKGGVEVPIIDLVDPEIIWIAEGAVSETKKGIDINASVSFKYFIGEIRIAQTLLSQVVSLPMLEQEIAQMLVRGYIKSCDKFILSGTGVGQPLGILKDTRVKAGNKISFSDTDVADWTQYRKKFFAKIPLAYQPGGVLVMTSATWESQIMTLRNDNNDPLARETYDVTPGSAIGGTRRSFAGREVILVEPGDIKDFDAATTGDPWALYLDPMVYAINSNLQIGFKRYFNEDTNTWINKALTIVDGKLLDTNGVYILTKAGT